MKKNLKYYLSPLLTKKEQEFIPTSFDVVGDIMVFSQFPDELLQKEQKIGQEILKQYNNINVVAKKIKQYSGKFRLPKTKIIAGQRRKTTTHKENNIQVKLHIDNVYFSARTATERKRITDLVQKGEDILVMFSGSGVLPIVLAKNAQPAHIDGVEINPEAHKFALENNKLNKTTNTISFYKGDVRTVLPSLNTIYDRILLPLPKGADKFLNVALTKAKKGTMVHLYQFLDKQDIPQHRKLIKQIIEENHRHCRILRTVLCGQYSPGRFRVCFDIRIV